MLNRIFFIVCVLFGLGSAAARAGWFEETWPGVYERIKHLSQEQGDYVPSECEPSDVPSTPEMSTQGLSFRLIDPKADFLKTCWPPQSPDMTVYHRPGEIMAYGRVKTNDSEEVLKEWIFAQAPNTKAGSLYQWTVKGEDYHIKYQPDDSLLISLKNSKGFIIPRPFYEDAKGRMLFGRWDISNPGELKLGINAAAEDYPLLIDPTLKYGQWLGAQGGPAFVRAMSYIANDKVIAGGDINIDGAMGLSGTVRGTYSGGNEGFVVEVLDAGTPTVNWMQFLGGNGNSQVFALTTSGTTIYAGGWSDKSTSWETVTFQGVHSGGSEGFTVAIIDGGTPNLNWGQWLGSDGDDQITAMGASQIASETRIYAAGWASKSTSWETTSFQGVQSAGSEGFVMSMTDGGTPTLNWGQWLGGNGDDQVLALTAFPVPRVVQSVGTQDTDGNSTHPVTVTATGSGNLIVVGICYGQTGSSISGVSDGVSSFTQFPSAAIAAPAGGPAGDLYYLASSNAGRTTITVTYNIGVADSNVHVWEVSGFSGVTTDGTAQVTGGGPSGGFAAGASLTPTSSTGFIVAIDATNGNVTSNPRPGNEFTSAGSVINGNAFSSLISTSAVAHRPVWTDNGSAYSSVTAAFKGTLTPQDVKVYAGGWATKSTSWETMTFIGTHGGGSEGFVVGINDGGTPALNWRQWLGSNGDDQVTAIAASGNMLYAGGWSNKSTSWETLTFQGTAIHTGSEGWVIEMTNGGTPALDWGQRLGGIGNDQVVALTISGSRIFAGGWSTQSTAWETMTFQGTHSGASEGFVVGINDGGTPVLQWGQWLGSAPKKSAAGTLPGSALGAEDAIVALAVSGSHVYAGGYSTFTTQDTNDPVNTDFETVTMQGPLFVGNQGFVIEIGDAASPTLDWGQVIGAGNSSVTNTIYAVAASGAAFYAGGNADNMVLFEPGTFSGSYQGGKRGFVTKVTDGSAPTVNWTRVFGNFENDNVTGVLSLGVDGTSIFAGGWNEGGGFAWPETFAYQSDGGFVVKMTDGGTPTVNWAQNFNAEADEPGIRALTISGGNIYVAGGINGATIGFSATTTRGTYSHGASDASREAIVAKILDGAGPTVQWLEYLGGDADDVVNALVISGSVLYAGGYSVKSTSWETTTFQGTHGGGSEGFVVSINDGGSPTIAWGQWLGSNGDDSVTALTYSAGSIYAGGWSNKSTSWETVTFQGTAIHTGSEGFVVKVTNGASPSLNWGHWLGGIADDQVTAVGHSAGTIYVGGWSTQSTAWETVTFTGTHRGGSEGFVVSMTDAGTPALNWRQWLGGAGNDVLLSLAVSGADIYAGSSASSSTDFTTMTFRGTFISAKEGVVVKVSDTVAASEGNFIFFDFLF